jgi:hypothetical protein
LQGKAKLFGDIGADEVDRACVEEHFKRPLAIQHCLEHDASLSGHCDDARGRHLVILAKRDSENRVVDLGSDGPLGKADNTLLPIGVHSPLGEGKQDTVYPAEVTQVANLFVANALDQVRGMVDPQSKTVTTRNRKLQAIIHGALVNRGFENIYESATKLGFPV